MKKLSIYFLMTSATLLLATTTFQESFAEGNAKELQQKGSVTVKDSGKTEIVDPEDPEVIVDPGTGPSTSGSLRIDYVSPLDFGKVKLTKSNRNYHALASKIGKTDNYRGSFIQISDFREKSSGWSLQVKQDQQFKTNDYDELKGAVLSLDKGWANSSSTKDAPTVTRDTLEINNIGEVYDVARATKGGGGGVWSINFGASKDNDDNQPSTITESKKSDSKEKVESVIKNSAVSLSIPDSTKVLPKEYQTKITWILAETP
ncbi:MULTISPECIES: WxL domain-containing protein [Vagococcus]|nr:MULTISPECIES: WxL domain-containing protein [Vagococcus]HCM88376.1 WxL domain-containing protein [Vagococcus sp.]